MKKLKIAVTALVVAGGTFSAFAFSANKENKAATTYYAIEDEPGSSSYHWSTSVPEDFECKDGGAVCSIMANTPPTDNQLPSGVTPTNKVYRLVEE